MMISGRTTSHDDDQISEEPSQSEIVMLDMVKVDMQRDGRTLSLTLKIKRPHNVNIPYSVRVNDVGPFSIQIAQYILSFQPSSQTKADFSIYKFHPYLLIAGIFHHLGDRHKRNILIGYYAQASNLWEEFEKQIDKTVCDWITSPRKWVW